MQALATYAGNNAQNSYGVDIWTATEHFVT